MRRRGVFVFLEEEEREGEVEVEFRQSPPDHMYPFGGFSFNDVNFVNLVQESDELRFASTFT